MDFAPRECEAVNEAASLGLALLQRRHPWKTSCQWSRSRCRRRHFIRNHPEGVSACPSRILLDIPNWPLANCCICEEKQRLGPILRVFSGCGELCPSTVVFLVPPSLPRLPRNQVFLPKGGLTQGASSPDNSCTPQNTQT